MTEDSSTAITTRSSTQASDTGTRYGAPAAEAVATHTSIAGVASIASVSALRVSRSRGSVIPKDQRSSLMRSRLPVGSRKAQSRTPYGCSVGSWSTSAPLSTNRLNSPSRSWVARVTALP